jgi:preprotein translocase subunit SecF
LLSTALAIIEAVLIAYPPTFLLYFVGQQIILAFSTILFFAIVIATYSFVPYHSGLTRWRKLKRILTIEILFELCTLIFGWILMFYYPG